MLSAQSAHKLIAGKDTYLSEMMDRLKEPGFEKLLDTQFIFFFFSSDQSLSSVQLFATPWTAAHQASLSITNSWGLVKLMSIESVIPSNHLIICHPLLLLPSLLPSIRVFSNDSVVHIRRPNIGASPSESVLSMNIQD